MNACRAFVSATFISVFAGSPCCAIVTSDAAGTHIVTPGVPAYGLDLDGVAIVGVLGPFGPIGVCTAALISDRHLLCAAHCFDENADGRLESPLGPFPNEIVFQLAGGWVAVPYNFQLVQVPENWPQLQADIAVVTLSQDAPPELPRYALYGSTDEVGQAAIFVGYGGTGHGSTGIVPQFDSTPTKRAGLNRIDDVRTDLPGVEFVVSDFDSGLAANNALALSGFESDLGFGADEVLSVTGDSGGPVFVNGAIAAVTAFGARLPVADVNSTQDFSWGEASFDTRISNYRGFILGATAGTARFVPEPAAIALINVASAIGIAKRRRIRARTRRA